MNKSRKLKILLTSFSILAATGVVTTTVASCGKKIHAPKNQTIIDNNISYSTDIFTNNRLTMPVLNALSTHLTGYTIALKLGSSIKANNFKVKHGIDAHKNAIIISVFADIRGKVTIGKSDYSYSAIATYTYVAIDNKKVGKFIINNLVVTTTKDDSTTPALESLIPTTSIFASNELLVPVANSFSKHLPIGTKWTLASAIAHTHVRTYSILIQGNLVIISSANIYGIITVNGVDKRFDATISYSLNDNRYAINNLVID